MGHKPSRIAADNALFASDSHSQSSSASLTPHKAKGDAARETKVGHEAKADRKPKKKRNSLPDGIYIIPDDDTPESLCSPNIVRVSGEYITWRRLVRPKPVPLPFVTGGVAPAPRPPRRRRRVRREGRKRAAEESKEEGDGERMRF